MSWWSLRIITDKHEAAECADQMQLVTPDTRKHKWLYKIQSESAWPNSTSYKFGAASWNWKQIRKHIQLKKTGVREFCNWGRLLTSTYDFNRRRFFTNAAELQEKCLFAFSCLDCSSAAVFHLLPVSWDMHKLNYFWGYSHNKARMSLHLSFVMWCNSLWENMYVLLHMETEVCLRSRFSHAVWSCLKRWEEEEEEPHPSSTELESVFSVISMERWFAFPREWLNIRWKREKERDQRNLLHFFGPEGANGKPANPKNSRDESANMNRVVIILLIVRWVKRENREMFWCLKKIEKCWRGEAPRSGGNSEKAWESQGKFSIIIVLKTF